MRKRCGSIILNLLVREEKRGRERERPTDEGSAKARHHEREATERMGTEALCCDESRASNKGVKIRTCLGSPWLSSVSSSKNGRHTGGACSDSKHRKPQTSPFPAAFDQPRCRESKPKPKPKPGRTGPGPRPSNASEAPHPFLPCHLGSAEGFRPCKSGASQSGL